MSTRALTVSIRTSDVVHRARVECSARVRRLTLDRHMLAVKLKRVIAVILQRATDTSIAAPLPQAELTAAVTVPLCLFTASMPCCAFEH
jgi:hypothetical protein